MPGKWHVPVAVAALGIIAVAGCSSSSSSSPNGGTTSASTPIASSSAVAKAKEQATTCLQKTGTSGLLTSSGRSELVNCLKNIVPPAEQQAFKSCMTSAAVSDQIWTSAGRSKFTNTSLPNCLNTAALPPRAIALRHGRPQRGRFQLGGGVIPERGVAGVVLREHGSGGSRGDQVAELRELEF
jgi:hypothetical protein